MENEDPLFVKHYDETEGGSAGAIIALVFGILMLIAVIVIVVL